VVKAFISYAHADHAAYDQAWAHLKALERAYDIEIWADKRIKPGDYWREEIAKAIDAALIHILLVSPAFFESNYIWDHELPAINAKCKSGALVLPIILKRCSWAAFLNQLQAAPMNPAGRLVPVADWKPRDNGFDAARDQVGNAIESRFGLRPKAMDWSRP
jgi:hypothetical protein